MLSVGTTEGAGVIPHPGENSLRGGYEKADLEFFALLKSDFRELRFVWGRKFAFRPPKTVVIGPSEAHARLLLLHEVGHAVCGHKYFRTGVERLKMEVAAWKKARELAASYGVDWDEEVAQGELDTYRDWLHQKSRCPKCGLTRFETPDGAYHCPRCEQF